MSQNACYAFDRGLNQLSANKLEALVQGQTSLAKGSPARLYRLVSNLYFDLYQNGWGEAHLFLPACMVELYRVATSCGWNVQSDEALAKAFDELNTFYSAHMKAYNAAYGDENDDLDEPIAQEDVVWPSSKHMFAHMELILDFVVVRVTECENPLASIERVSSVA